MNFTQVSAIVDDAINLFSHNATQKQNYEAQLKEKDEEIADLKDQLQTANSTLNADNDAIAQLNTKLASLDSLIKGQASTAPAVTTTAATPTAINSSQPTAIAAT